MPVKNKQLKSEDKNTSNILWRRIVQIVLIIIILVASYILLLQFVAKKNNLSTKDQQIFLHDINTTKQDRLIIPKISVNTEISEGDWRVLDRKQVWHRFPERGNPLTGGNFILAAHRYVFAWLPQKVNEASILYNITDLSQGDKIYVDWHGARYTYTITNKQTVNPNDSQIEEQTIEPRLTLYSCTVSGERDGREVIIAKLEGK
jgi:sortase A